MQFLEAADGNAHQKAFRRTNWRNPEFHARRWVIEVTRSFFNRFRKLLVRFEKKAANYLPSFITRLISVRQERQALQSGGKIEFIYAEEYAYPLDYPRNSAAEKLLVILSPSAQAAAFPGTYVPKRAVHHFGAEAKFDGARITVPSCSAGFYALT